MDWGIGFECGLHIFEYEYERLISMNTKPSYRKLNHTCIGADRKHYKLQL